MNGGRKQLRRLRRSEPLPFLGDGDRNYFKFSPVEAFDDRARGSNRDLVFT
jgi:hypothetical protein